MLNLQTFWCHNCHTYYIHLLKFCVIIGLSKQKINLIVYRGKWKLSRSLVFYFDFILSSRLLEAMGANQEEEMEEEGRVWTWRWSFPVLSACGTAWSVSQTKPWSTARQRPGTREYRYKKLASSPNSDGTAALLIPPHPNDALEPWSPTSLSPRSLTSRPWWHARSPYRGVERKRLSPDWTSNLKLFIWPNCNLMKS